jgi:hypothetical protein
LVPPTKPVDVNNRKSLVVPIITGGNENEPATKKSDCQLRLLDDFLVRLDSSSSFVGPEGNRPTKDNDHRHFTTTVDHRSRLPAIDTIGAHIARPIIVSSETKIKQSAHTS